MTSSDKKRHVVGYVIKDVSNSLQYGYPPNEQHEIQQMLMDDWEPWGSPVAVFSPGQSDIQLQAGSIEFTPGNMTYTLYQVFVRYEEAPDVKEGD